MDLGLGDKVVLVSGSWRGTGAGIARVLAREALASAGRLDALVNNFGLAEGAGWLDTPTRDWVDIYERKALSGVRLVQQVVPGMRERGWGRVIFISTVGRIGTTEEVGALIAFLCSAHAGFISGSDLRIDGGAAGCT